jgi:hypothetical protein
MTKKELIAHLLVLGAESLRVVQESGMTITVEFEIKRSVYEQAIEPQLDDPEAPDFKGELRRIEKVNTTGGAGGSGLWRYTILVFKF